MREAAWGHNFELIRLGIWSTPDGTPVSILCFTRLASPSLPKRTGAAVFQAASGSETPVQCLDELDMGGMTFLGDPNGDPSPLNGDVPYAFGLADEERIASSLGLILEPALSNAALNTPAPCGTIANRL